MTNLVITKTVSAFIKFFYSYVRILFLIKNIFKIFLVLGWMVAYDIYLHLYKENIINLIYKAFYSKNVCWFHISKSCPSSLLIK